MKDCSNCAHGGTLKDVAHCAVTHEIVRLPMGNSNRGCWLK